MLIPPPVIPPALAAMAAFPQWICWQLVQKPGQPKPAKVPTDPISRLPIDAQDSRYWMDSATAVATALSAGLGIGFVFTENDPFFFLDLDDCANPGDATAPWQPHATQLISRLPGAAIEISCSGRGLHLFGRCAPGLIHGKKNADLRAELYTSKRFVALGTGAVGDANLDCTQALWPFAAEFFPPPANLTGAWTDEPEAGKGIADDATLIAKALASRSAGAAFGGKATFKDLYEGNDIALAIAYPSGDAHRAYDGSSADMALAAHLAFWTGGNCDQVHRIMLTSALNRPKWEREDYLPNTIMKVVGSGGDYYQGKRTPSEKQARERELLAEAIAASSPPPPAPAPPVASAPPPAPPPPPAALPPGMPPLLAASLVTPPPPAATNAAPVAGPGAPAPDGSVRIIDAYPYCPPDEMLAQWANHIYVVSVNRVLTPQGDLYDQGQFKAMYGRRIYPKDHRGNDGDTTDNAWKAYMDSQCYDFHKANALRFLPGNPNRLVHEGPIRYANIWTDPKPRRLKGDPSPFLNHVRMLLPNGQDAEQLLAYMAACVQHQGQKFTWCPLIQGVQGNGKSTIAKVLEAAIGPEYVHIMKGSSITNQFNGWLSSNSMVVVEDLHVTQSVSLDVIKPMITADRLEIERKGIDQVTEYICCNFMLTTNHKSAIPLDPNERRFAIFFCAQQTKEDLARQGITDAYFNNLWDWLRADGLAILSEYLWSYDIPHAMNPATGCKTAPETTSHQAAIEESRSTQAQYIQGAIDSEEPGFRDRWVSTVKVAALLQEHRCSVSPNQFRKILEDMGYKRHPGLREGQASRTVVAEGGRPRLYVKDGHLSINLLSAPEIMAAYEKAQGYAASVVLPLSR